jgi:hypothetical protein
MDKQQAFNVIKGALDAAVKGGIFNNLDTVLTVNNALAVLIQPETITDAGKPNTEG